jgi:hypothetical protein
MKIANGKFGITACGTLSVNIYQFKRHIEPVPILPTGIRMVRKWSEKREQRGNEPKLKGK